MTRTSGTGGGIYSTSTLHIEDSEIIENITGSGSIYRGGHGVASISRLAMPH